MIRELRDEQDLEAPLRDPGRVCEGSGRELEETLGCMDGLTFVETEVAQNAKAHTTYFLHRSPAR
ncbi:MAG: hypothetical protein R3F62_19200 [Planctomycetota bacterium]